MADYAALIAALKAQGAADAQALAERAIAGTATAEELIAGIDKIPAWRERDYSEVPVGKPYKLYGKVYQLARQHLGTLANAPDKGTDYWKAVTNDAP